MSRREGEVRGGLWLLAGVGGALGVWQLLVWWNKPPAIEFDNLRYLQLLTTAVSARNSDWVGRVERAVSERHGEGAMSDEELRAFRKILSSAVSGEWEQAERECYRLGQAQLNRRRSRPASSVPAQEGADGDSAAGVSAN